MWLYVTEGLVRSTSEAGPGRWLAAGEVLLCVALFTTATVYIRRRLRAALGHRGEVDRLVARGHRGDDGGPGGQGRGVLAGRLRQRPRHRLAGDGGELVLGLAEAEGKFLDLAGELADARLGAVETSEHVVRGERRLLDDERRLALRHDDGHAVLRRRENLGRDHHLAVPLPRPLDRASRRGLGSNGEGCDRREDDGSIQTVHEGIASLARRDARGDVDRSRRPPRPHFLSRVLTAGEFGQSEANRPGGAAPRHPGSRRDQAPALVRTMTARRFCDQHEMSSQTATGRSLP